MLKYTTYESKTCESIQPFSCTGKFYDQAYTDMVPLEGQCRITQVFHTQGCDIGVYQQVPQNWLGSRGQLIVLDFKPHLYSPCLDSKGSQ